MLDLCNVMMVIESSPVGHMQIANVQFREFGPFLQKSLSSNQESFIKNLKEKCQIILISIYFLRLLSPSVLSKIQQFSMEDL